MTLDIIQLRVLGALIEKEITTPEKYPLSLNSLISACNQRSSRDPVLDLAEDEVRQAVHSLEDLEIVAPVRDSRVPKYEHRIRTVLNLRRDETALICLLMLRGPQTPGELRGRSDRMYSFDDIAAVQAALERLANRKADPSEEHVSNDASNSQALVQVLPRQPGSRESRWVHLLGGPVAELLRQSSAPGLVPSSAGRAPSFAEEPAPGDPALTTRVAALEDTVRHLISRLNALEGVNSRLTAPPQDAAE